MLLTSYYGIFINDKQEKTFNHTNESMRGLFQVLDQRSVWPCLYALEFNVDAAQTKSVTWLTRLGSGVKD